MRNKCPYGCTDNSCPLTIGNVFKISEKKKPGRPKRQPTPKEPETVHGNEAKKEGCEHPKKFYLGDGVSQCAKCFEFFEDD